MIDLPRLSRWCFALAASCCLLTCQPPDPAPRNVPLEEIAGTPAIREYMAGFTSRGIQSDSSVLPAPEATRASLRVPDELTVDLLLAEPRVNQPVELNFDHRGRLWVVQYQQYPYPEGVKVAAIDHHSRVRYDRTPGPPGSGRRGADKITVFTDTDGDGTYDVASDAVTGLNITTGVEWGRRKLWVLTPPYLVAYPDPDGNGLPDGPAEVHLSGFGLEDTHAVANSLRWGPDGWLYGAQGSTTTAALVSAVGDTVRFRGQGIWRYHPEKKICELFAEGGGNTFDVEFDAKGRLYSGDNGVTCGFYYKQGGYYRKNWGKHGPLTNPYAFGYLPGMEVDGKRMRFTHAWIRYEGGALPDAYAGKVR
ncbi:MAG: dehydrogenase, partial [Bacteroidota bacterium]